MTSNHFNFHVTWISIISDGSVHVNFSPIGSSHVNFPEKQTPNYEIWPLLKDILLLMLSSNCYD